MAILTPTLRLFEPILTGTGYVADLTRFTKDSWRRSIRRDGGYWRGSFTLPVSDELKISRQWITQFYYEFLGFDLKETAGGFPTWNGQVYEMDLTLDGETYRRSLDLMFNHAKTTYINTADPPDVATSAAATNDESIARYGRREELLLADGTPQAEAENNRDTFLKENGWPWARPVGTRNVPDQLEVTVCGYAFTAAWRFLTAGDDSEDDASTFVGEIIDTDCEFLSAGKITENTYQVKKGKNVPTRAWDVLMDIVSRGDANETPWRFWVGDGRRAYYEPIDTTVQYYLRKGVLYSSAGSSTEVNPWIVKPAVIRNMSYPVRRAEYGGWFEDPRDSYLSEVEVGPNGLVRKSEIFEESELLAAQQAYEEQLERQRSRESGGRERLNWKRKYKLPEELWEESRSWSRKKKQEWIDAHDPRKKG